MLSSGTAGAHGLDCLHLTAPIQKLDNIQPENFIQVHIKLLYIDEHYWNPIQKMFLLTSHNNTWNYIGGIIQWFDSSITFYNNYSYSKMFPALHLFIILIVWPIMAYISKNKVCTSKYVNILLRLYKHNHRSDFVSTIMYSNVCFATLFNVLGAKKQNHFSNFWDYLVYL